MENYQLELTGPKIIELDVSKEKFVGKGSKLMGQLVGHHRLPDQLVGQLVVGSCPPSSFHAVSYAIGGAAAPPTV